MTTKQQEIALWQAFVAGLPKDGYLYRMFAGSESMIEGMIRNDFAYPPIPEIRLQQDAIQADVTELTKKRDQLSNDVARQEERVKSLAREVTRNENLLDELRREAKRIAGL